jgi:hypothetical protein
MKMKIVNSPETFVPIYQSTRRRITDVSDFNRRFFVDSCGTNKCTFCVKRVSVQLVHVRTTVLESKE